MAFSVQGTSCCGVYELKDISTLADAEAVMKEAIPQMHRRSSGWQERPAYITFTGVVDRVQGDHASYRTDNYAQALADYIKANDLGEVVESIPSKPNWTRNVLKMYVWMPNFEKLEQMRQKIAAEKVAVSSHTHTINIYGE
jgi:hypothetical protein